MISSPDDTKFFVEIYIISAKYHRTVGYSRLFCRKRTRRRRTQLICAVCRNGEIFGRERILRAARSVGVQIPSLVRTVRLRSLDPLSVKNGIFGHNGVVCHLGVVFSRFGLCKPTHEYLSVEIKVNDFKRELIVCEHVDNFVRMRAVVLVFVGYGYRFVPLSVERYVAVGCESRTAVSFGYKRFLFIPAAESKSFCGGNVRNNGLRTVFFYVDSSIVAVSAIVIRYGNLRNGYNAGVICFV